MTYATAAVGITLTAASRVYLMEPSIDPAQVRACLPNPSVGILQTHESSQAASLLSTLSLSLHKPAQELQAAGRIHRLGQTKEIFIKRFAFKDSIEEAVCAMHDKVKKGDLKMVDGRFANRDAAEKMSAPPHVATWTYMGM